MESVVNFEAYSQLYCDLKEERNQIHLYLVEKMKQFNDIATFHLVDPDEYYYKLQEQIAIDKQLKILESKLFN